MLRVAYLVLVLSQFLKIIPSRHVENIMTPYIQVDSVNYETETFIDQYITNNIAIRKGNMFVV